MSCTCVEKNGGSPKEQEKAEARVRVGWPGLEKTAAKRPAHGRARGDDREGFLTFLHSSRWSHMSWGELLRWGRRLPAGEAR